MEKVSIDGLFPFIHYGMKREKNLYRILRKWLCYLVIFLVLWNAISYQWQWREKTEAKLNFRNSMQENGDGKYAAALLKEMRYFPVVPDAKGRIAWSYEDGYGGTRTYGGKRKHEGVDIMSSADRPGCLQICSVSDGVIEQLGWLELGGYRMGIRSSSGLYYYYAHLDSYADGLAVGDTVQAGEVIGFMGNTGYGPEGTRGQFAVHLHFGIYVTEKGQEKSMNPYPALCYIEERSAALRSCRHKFMPK